VKFAIVGTGYVCDYYLTSLAYNPDVTLVGVYDRDQARAKVVADKMGVKQYQSLDELLADDEVVIVANLTNPKAHYEVSKACLEAGKHVYSEKPLADDFEDAKKLVALAAERGLEISSAPCSMLSETAQTLWKALDEGAIGTPRIVYAELDDGPVYMMPLDTWLSNSGTPWPYIDEFESGCTVEHAGYWLTWFTAFFGPATRVTAFAHEVIRDKTDPPLVATTPDFTVGCVEFASGVVARLTFGIVAPHNHGLMISGDKGYITLDDCWKYRLEFFVHEHITRHGIAARPWLAKLLGFGPRKVKPIEMPDNGHGQSEPLEMMDFCRGITDLAEAIRDGRRPRLSAEHALHITELTLAIQHPETMGTPRVLESSFDPIEPMKWVTDAVVKTEVGSLRKLVKSKATPGDGHAARSVGAN
jgi:predicted dehydrogenase